MSDFEEQPGHDPAMTELARGLHQQAVDMGITKDEGPEAPRPERHDPRFQNEFAGNPETLPAGSEPAEASDTAEPRESEAPAGEDDPAEEAVPEGGEEVLSADAVIKLDDGREVTARELAESSMMQADYTRKTQELSEQRKQLEAQTQNFVGEYSQRVQQLDQLAQALQVEMNALQNPQELQRLAQDDPGEYSKRMLDMQRRESMIRAANQQQQAIASQQQQARIPYERAALVEKNKAFADDFDGSYRQVGEWVLDPAGGELTPDIWNGVYDHRFVNIAHKAMLWDKMHRQAASETAPRIREHAQRKPTAVRPGVSQPAKTARAAAAEDYQRALEDKDAMRTTDGIAAAFLARERLKSSRG